MSTVSGSERGGQIWHDSPAVCLNLSKRWQPTSGSHVIVRSYIVYTLKFWIHYCPTEKLHSAYLEFSLFEGFIEFDI